MLPLEWYTTSWKSRKSTVTLDLFSTLTMTERKVWAKSTAPNSAAFRVKVYEGDLVDDLKKAIAIEKRFNYGADLLIVKEEPDTPVLIEVDMKLIFSTTGIGATKENPYYFSEPTGNLFCLP